MVPFVFKNKIYIKKNFCQYSQRSNEIKSKQEVSFTLPQEIMFKVAKTDLFDNYVFSAKLFHMLRVFGI